MTPPDSLCTLADLCEFFARRDPDQVAIAQGRRRTTWHELDRRADGVALALLGAGIGHQERVAQYLFNGPEYVESFVAATKAGLVPVNTNFRYQDRELVHVWSDSDAAAVVFHGTFIPRIERVLDRVPGVRRWLWVDDGTGPCPPWAMPYEAAARQAQRRTVASWGRRGEDLFFLYTGGTTGLPRAVMWRQDRFLSFFGGDRHPADREPVITLAAAPLMHGLGIGAVLRALTCGGTAVLLDHRSLDPEELWGAAERECVQQVNIVGDAFALPLVDALDAAPARWELSRLRAIASGGATLSESVRQRLLGHLPWVRVVDQLGSSENAGGARRVHDRRSDTTTTGSFSLLPGTRVVDDVWRDVEPGSGDSGVLVVPGGAEGYHKDPERSAATFPTIDGIRYTVTGDYATVERDGTVRLLGRGSLCINTGGEKVFPEEVESALRAHPAIGDAVVVGVPDERFGQSVAALIEVFDALDPDDVRTFVGQQLAGYKVPRRVFEVKSVDRAPNGKVDYVRARALVVEQMRLVQGSEA